VVLKSKKSSSSGLTPAAKNNGALSKAVRAEARLAAAFRRAVRELDRCHRRSGCWWPSARTRNATIFKRHVLQR
jgi:hypothetical protein